MRKILKENGKYSFIVKLVIKCEGTFMSEAFPEFDAAHVKISHVRSELVQAALYTNTYLLMPAILLP